MTDLVVLHGLLQLLFLSPQSILSQGALLLDQPILLLQVHLLREGNTWLTPHLYTHGDRQCGSPGASKQQATHHLPHQDVRGCNEVFMKKVPPKQYRLNKQLL